MHKHFPFLLYYYFYYYYIIISIIITIISSSSSSNSTSRSIIISIIIISSSSINKISVLLTISTSIFKLAICFLLFYINIPHYCFQRDHNGNKVAQLFCVIPAITAYGELFTTIFNFNEFIFAYVVNIRFICDGEIYLLTY